VRDIKAIEMQGENEVKIKKKMKKRVLELEENAGKIEEVVHEQVVEEEIPTKIKKKKKKVVEL
jgi:hypothetical protein